MKYLLILIVLFFTSCGNIQDKVRNSIQSDNAKQIRNNYKEIITLLSSYQSKLNKRNPKNYNLTLVSVLKKNMNNNENTLKLFKDELTNPKKYTDYLNYAFDKKVDISNRNDYLIIGLYKMFYSAYKMDTKYKMFALSYNLDDLQKAYKNLQVIQWKIKFDKNIENKYLFLTWQNNWQIELADKLQHSKLDNVFLSQLVNISSNNESLLDPSNSSFEIITSKMLLYMENSIKKLHAEPENLSTEAILSFIFLI